MTAAVAVVFLVALMLAPLADAADRTGGELVSAAASLSPLALVKSSTARVLAIVHSQPVGVTVGDERRTEIRRVAQSLFDFGESGRRALGPHWNGHSPAEQGEFVRLFTDMLKQFYLSGLPPSPSSWRACGARDPPRRRLASSTPRRSLTTWRWMPCWAQYSTEGHGETAIRGERLEETKVQ